jgi:hypothetical protein
MTPLHFQKLQTENIIWHFSQRILQAHLQLSFKGKNVLWLQKSLQCQHTTEKNTDKSTGYNSTFAIMAGKVRIQPVVQLIKFGRYRQLSVPNPPQRKAANR